MRLIYIVGVVLLLVNNLQAQVGYYDAPYVRYEADLGILTSALITPKSYSQSLLQSEASAQVCVDLSATGASVEWILSAEGDGLVVRYSLPDGQAALLDVYADNVFVGTLSLTTVYAWEDLKNNGNPNNVGIQNTNPRMRFDEVRMKLPSTIAAGGSLKLVRQSGAITVDFVELEVVPSAILSSVGDVIYSGTGSDLQNFIDLNGGKTIYLPAAVYNVNRQLYFGVANTILKGAGMWYTQLNFTNVLANRGGLLANAPSISFSGLYLTTVRNSRSNSYKAINGVYTSGSTITNIWAEHFECGAWIAQYNIGGPSVADGFTVSNCRFRNNYADGINLCRGTSNAVVEHCNFRNNGDDDMAIWSADGMECQNNTFRYNTSENCWRASGCAIYGGFNNKVHHLLIKDNLEAGLKVNNSFSGAGFNDGGMHEFSDITIIRCGTFNDLYYSPKGAIDITCTNVAGTKVKNVKFYNITILDSKNDAIYMYKTNGEGFYNIVFENITINGTGKEYPNNNAKALNWGRGYGILFVGSPAGYATYCGMSYSNRGGNATVDINNAQIGSLSWTSAGCGTYVTAPLNGAIFGECDPLITLLADASSTNGAVDSVEFFIDGVKVGMDELAPYSYDWTGFTLGTHKTYVRSIHAPSSTIIVSSVKEIVVAYYKGIFTTAIVPVIDGSIDPLWASHTAVSIEKISLGNFSGAADLSATYQVTYDATNLYVLVDVIDDVLKNDGGDLWENDGVELFIDIGNDKSGGYGVDDYAYMFAVNDATVYEGKNKTAGVAFSQGNKTGGYRMEISIPWSTLSAGFSLATGAYLGLDIHINDDDDGGIRDAKKAWNDCADIAWKNPTSFGTLQESGCATAAPAGFVDFQTSVVNGKAVLNWSYYKELGSHFEVLRDAIGDGDFLLVTNVSATGSVGILSSRSYTDTNTPEGVVAYRISKVDAKGCIIMTEIETLDLATGVSGSNSKEAVASFFPNPFSSTGTLTLASGNGNLFAVSILDSNGKVIWNKNLPENTTYTIGEQLLQGMYIVEVVEGATKKILKLIKI